MNEEKLILSLMVILLLVVTLPVYMSKNYVPKNIEVICDGGVISYSENTPVIIGRDYLSCKETSL